MLFCKAVSLTSRVTYLFRMEMYLAFSNSYKTEGGIMNADSSGRSVSDDWGELFISFNLDSSAYFKALNYMLIWN